MQRNMFPSNTKIQLNGEIDHLLGRTASSVFISHQMMISRHGCYQGHEKHNHPMCLGVAQYSRSALKLDPSMIEMVKQCTEIGFGMPETRKYLESKFPEKYFHGPNQERYEKVQT